jgi:uncharacterized membrane protein YczE
VVRRLSQLLFGLVVCGVGVAAMVLAELGLSPWDVLHEGVSDRTGMGIGTANVVVALLVLTLWLPLRQRPGIGTIANALLIGTVADLVLLVAEPPSAAAVRWVLTVSGVVVFGIGVALYIGAGLGPGPRDGLMTGLHDRTGRSIASVRTAIELTALLAGLAMGGTLGVGTLLFAFGIGPVVQAALPRFTLPPRTTTAPGGMGAAEPDENERVGHKAVPRRGALAVDPIHVSSCRPP